METQSDASTFVSGHENGEHEAIANPKMYKTTLCQFYLQGPCKNGDACSYAHGTSDLRTSSGMAVKEMEAAAGDKRIKSKLCEKFLQFGACQFGATCNFAHGVRELQKAVASLNHASNPAFKTSLCKNYMGGMYCQFADQCQYAHGEHELREKPFTPPGDIPDDVKQRLIVKARSRQDYKSKLCTNFMENGFCEYDDLCHYAHGKDELAELNISSESYVGQRGRRFKTAMCKNGANCSYGESCQFAHSQSELNPAGFGGSQMQASRPQGSNYKTTLCKNYIVSKQCQFGPGCQFAHGHHELRPAFSAMASAGPKFKTAMCQSVMLRQPCPRGPTCHFAHSPMELRSGNPMTGPPAHQAGGSGGPRYKTVMCTNISGAAGQCPRGSSCNFAHSHAEMTDARNSDPRYKTALCENYKNDGNCEKGSMCVFAHGAAELRSKGFTSAMGMSSAASSSMPATYFGTGGGFAQNASGYGGYSASGYGAQGYGAHTTTPAAEAYGGYSTAATFGATGPGGYGAGVNGSSQFSNPRYKTVLCQAFMTKGYCERNENCSFAHGVAELTNSESYKTAMCRNLTTDGTCPKGNICHFAHSADELRPSSVSGGATLKRKHVKTMLCQNYTTFGECQYGDSCTFAHGEEELQINKRQRL